MRPLPYFSTMYSRITADSATVLPSSVITGDLPSGWMLCSEGGARLVFGSRSYLTSSYCTPSSSSSQSTRCDRELLRWWTVSIGRRFSLCIGPIHNEQATYPLADTRRGRAVAHVLDGPRARGHRRRRDRGPARSDRARRG